MKTRQSNVELLRILSMLIIVLYHISVYSSISGDQLFGANKFIQFYYGVTANSGQLGVMIFVLISSYFLCQQSFKIQRIIRIWAQLAFYVVLETIVILSFRGAFPQYFDKLKWYEVFNPLFFGSTYWFILPYVALTLLAPFLNIIVRRINQKQHLVLIGLLFLFVPVMSTLCERFGHTYWFAEIYGWWFLCYFVASYIRYYPSMKKKFMVGYCYVCFIIGCLYGIYSRSNLHSKPSQQWSRCATFNPNEYRCHIFVLPIFEYKNS